MRKILYISMCLPFDKVAHAGGKTLNYYIKAFAQDLQNDVKLVVKVFPDEEKYLASIPSRIEVFPVSISKNYLKRFLGYLKSINSKINPFYKYGNTLLKDIYDQIEKRLRQLQTSGYKPDVVILEWTQMVLFVDKVKRYFPNAIYVASEHDVTFLSHKRKVEACHNPVKQAMMNVVYAKQKNNELQALMKCDLIVTQNYKDKQLLMENNIDENRLDVIAPYFDHFNSKNRISNNKDIIFYGAMNRMENYTAAIWFIKNVMSKLQDLDIRFIVIGNNPPEELKRMQKENILVTGFVEDPTQYFCSAMCLVAPLLYGAGVKVKIIEALSSGVPVLTNHIGIEGIEAHDGKEFFLCESPEDYEEIIRKIKKGQIDKKNIADNAVKLIKKQYDLKSSYLQYSNRIYSLMQSRMESFN